MNTRGFFLLVTISAALLFAVGCGGSGGDGVTVQTGSLTKAEFIEKADAICKAARTEFTAKFESFYEAHQAQLTNSKNQDAFFGEVLESILGPNIEGQIQRISKLGAPSDYASEVAAFLNALQKRIDEAQGKPALLVATPTPFKEAEDAAKRAGMKGCSESFS